MHSVTPADAGLRFNAVWNEFRWCVIDTAAEPTSTTGIASSGLATHEDSDTLDMAASAGTAAAVEVLYNEDDAPGDQNMVQVGEEHVRAEVDEEVDELTDDDFDSVPPADAPRLADLLAKLKNEYTPKEDKVLSEESKITAEEMKCPPKENKCARRQNTCPSPQHSSTASSTRSDPASASRWTPLVIESGSSDDEGGIEDDDDDASSDGDSTVRVVAAVVAPIRAVDAGACNAHQSPMNPSSSHGPPRPSVCSNKNSCRLGAQCSFRKQT